MSDDVAVPVEARKLQTRAEMEAVQAALQAKLDRTLQILEAGLLQSKKDTFSGGPNALKQAAIQALDFLKGEGR